MKPAIAIGAAFSLALAVYLFRLDTVVGHYVDDAWYVLLAQAVAAGSGYHLISAPTPDMAAMLPASPPGFPLVLSLVVKLAPAFPANVIWLKAVSVFAMLGVGALAIAYYRQRAIPVGLATALALIVMLTPAFVWLATSTVMSEPMFTCATLLAVVLVGQQRPVAGGLAAGAAALVRSAGLPLLAAVTLWYVVRRQRRAAAGFAAAALVVFLPWAIYARAHATPVALRLEHGGAHVFTYAEQFWMRRAGEVESGRVRLREIPSRVALSLVDIVARDVGAIVMPELYRSAIESGEETLSVGGRRSDLTVGGMGNTAGTMAVSSLLSLVALVGFAARWRHGAGVAEYFVPLALVPIVLFPHWAYRFVLPLTPFLYGYLVDGVRAFTAAWPRVLRIALACIVVLHVLDHAMYRVRITEAVWPAEAREGDEVLAWMDRELDGPGAVASTNPALVFLRTGRAGVAIGDARAHWAAWRADGVRYLVDLDGGALPDRALGYRVLFQTDRSKLWVIEMTD